MADTVAFGRRKTSGGAPPPIMGIGCVRTAQTIINSQWRSAGLSTMNGCNTPLSNRWAAESSYKNPTSPNSFAAKFRTTNTMQHQLGALATCAVAFVYFILRRRRRLFTIKDIPGPANPSWIFGRVNLVPHPLLRLMVRM